jgi:rare lipoprotein A
LHGNPTASGEFYNENELTAAHRTWGFGTKVRVTNLSNGETVVVRINDRGPYAEGRVIDLSYAAAARLGFLEDGVAEVRLEILNR